MTAYSSAVIGVSYRSMTLLLRDTACSANLSKESVSSKVLKLVRATLIGIFLGALMDVHLWGMSARADCTVIASSCDGHIGYMETKENKEFRLFGFNYQLSLSNVASM